MKKGKESEGADPQSTLKVDVGSTRSASKFSNVFCGHFENGGRGAPPGTPQVGSGSAGAACSLPDSPYN